MNRIILIVALLAISSDSTWGQIVEIPNEALEHPLPFGMEKVPELSQLNIEEKKSLAFQIAPLMLDVYNNIATVDQATADKMIEDRMEDIFRYMEEGFSLNDRIQAVKAANKEIEAIIVRQNELLGEGRKNTQRMASFSEFMFGARMWEYSLTTIYAFFLTLFGLSNLMTLLMVEFPNSGVSRSMKSARHFWLLLKPKQKESLPEIEERLGLAYGHIRCAHLYTEEARKLSNQGGYLGSVSKAIRTLHSALKEFGIRSINPEGTRFSLLSRSLDKAHKELDEREGELKTAEANFDNVIAEKVTERSTDLNQRAKKVKSQEILLAIRESVLANREDAASAASRKAALDLATAQELMAEAELNNNEAKRLHAEGKRLSEEGIKRLTACAGLSPSKKSAT